MSSKLDFRGVDKAFGQERVRYWGILQRIIRLSECTELGFVDFPGSCEVSLVFWTGVFLSPGRRIRVTGKETGPGPGGYG